MSASWRWLSWKPRAVIEAEHRAFLDECSALYEETRPKTAREQLLETHLLRVLEAAKDLEDRCSDMDFHSDKWDQAVSDAKGVLRG